MAPADLTASLLDERTIKMRKIIEYALISVDGVFSNPAGDGFMGYRDDGYLRDGLGQLTQCDAMIMGRGFYDGASRMWPDRTERPWAARINEMKKYVVSSTLANPTCGRAPNTSSRYFGRCTDGL